MIYFDTDVLVNYCVKQQIVKHEQAIQLVEQAINDGLFFISALSLNELAFVLVKLRLSREEITKHLNDFYPLGAAAITLEHVQRAAQLGYQVSFHHMSDCLHTAVAESFCTELYTYNRSDFQLITHHTTLKITIL
ncbi:PIN domain-containing protein [Spirosoma luteum]|uniref:PIN domain-containing protein n=1 Tax=Spirosoma luteum TaxID=431553 RepID=UPI000377D0A3|nr:PIN domain-containing protein [Spirosoma luteum]